MKAKTKKFDLRSMVEIALCVAILSVSSYLVIPLPFTPIVLSMHTVMVNIIGLILGPVQAAATIGLYLLMGLIGLPIFSGGTAGAAKLFGPTGGFYFGFFFAVIIISLLKGKRPDIIRYSLVTALAGIPIQHIFAVIFMCFHNNFDVKAAFMSVSLPFIPGDLIKCVLASVIAAALNKVLSKLHKQ